MALIICEECGSQMSDKAQSCPKCGAPNPNVSKQTPMGFTFNPCAWHSNMPAVSSCVTCGRAMCKNCTDSVLFTVNNKPQCNECSLAMLAENIAANKKKKTWSIVKLVFLLFFILIGLIIYLSDPNSAMDAWICAGIGGLPSALKTFMTRSTEEKLVDEAMSRIDPGEGCTQQIMGLLVGAVFAVLLAPVAAIWFTIKNILAIVRSNRAIQADQEDYDTIQLRMQGKEGADSSANIPAQSEAPSQSGTPVQPAMPNQAPIHEEVHAAQPQQTIQASSATSTTSEVVAPSKSNNNKLIGIVAGALILFGFMVGYFLWYVPYAKDRDALRTYVIANTVLLRSSKMTDSEYNVVSKVPYGAELITYTKDSEWAEVKVDGVEGFAASPYLLEWSDFQLLDNVWGSVIVKECIESSKCRLAVLDYCKRNQFNTGIDGWQLYTLHKDMKPNMVLFPRLNNGHDKFTEFAFILKNNVTQERKLALYSFDEGSEMPIFLYEENAPADGEIKDIRFNSGRNKYTVSYTGNAPQKTNRATVQKEEKKQPPVEPQQVKETPEPAPSATKAEAIDNNTAAIVGETSEDTGETPVRDVTKGLYAYYTFEDNTKNSVRGGYNAAPINNPTYVESMNGTKAIKFSSSNNSSITIPEAMIDGCTFTVSFWVKGLSDGHIFSVPSSGYYDTSFDLVMLKGSLAYTVRGTNVDFAPKFVHSAFNGSEWSMVTLTSEKDGMSAIIKLYVNGVYVSRIKDIMLDYSLNKGISFMFGGKLVWNGGNKTINAVNMTVDNLRIYNGRALNASEVMQVYEYESR